MNAIVPPVTQRAALLSGLDHAQAHAGRPDYRLRNFDSFPIAALLKKSAPDVYKQCEDMMARTRDYAERHLHGRVAHWDMLAGEDHNFVPWDAIDGGLKYGFLGMALPRPFGGGGIGPLEAAVFSEELGAADPGVFVIYGAHILAMGLVLASLDMPLLHFLAREIVEPEKQGRATLLALAHTEPGGGSDVEDGEDIKTAKLGSRFEKVPGGFRVNARKVFISNGAIARYYVLTAWGDLHNPTETTRFFIIPRETPGVSMGRVEHKMGQRLCGAAEIICEDVFVPEHMSRLMDPDRDIDTVLTLTRGPVGGLSTGIIRSTLERTLAYVGQQQANGRRLYDEQWVQMRLADMLATLQACRGLYMDAAITAQYSGIGRLMTLMPFTLPTKLRNSRLMTQLLAHPLASRPARTFYKRLLPTPGLQKQVAHSSIAKFMCSDLAVQTAMHAMEILGEDANDPQWGIEKGLRDAKLAQIFEGTNQINRLQANRGLLTS